MCSLSIAEDFQKSFLHGELTIRILKAEELSDIDENTHNQGNASCIFLKRPQDSEESASSSAKKSESEEGDDLGPVVYRDGLKDGPQVP